MIRFIEPPHDILIKKADPSQLKAFIQFLNLALKNSKAYRFSQLTTKPEQLPQENLNINGNENYPKSFSNSLKTISLNNCKLKIIDPRILKLCHLHTLDLQGNKIIELPSALSSLPLRNLNVADNKIEQFPKEICTGNLMQFLLYLNLNGNLISVLPPEFCHFKQLNSLKISSNKLIKLPENIGKLRNLKVFMARNNCLKYLPISILTLHLEVLDITDNSFRSKQDLSLPKFEVYSLLDCAFLSIKKYNLQYRPEDVPSLLLSYLDNDYGECICGRIVVSSLSSTIIFSNVGKSSVVTYSHRLNPTVPIKIHYCSLNCWRRQVFINMGKRKVRGNVAGTSKDNVKDNAIKNSKGNKKLKCEESSNLNAKEEGTSKVGKFENVTIPVDEECSLENVHVYCEDGEVFNAMLNQTNVQNNNNKYYLLQLLKHNSNEEYFAWFRWGRVGKKGQSSLQSFKSDLDGAKACFEEKFRSKTKNEWENRNDFVKYSGKYDLLQMDYNKTNSDSKSEVSKESKKINDVSESELKKELQDLMKLIFDLKAMEEVVKKMNYDAKKNPLGKLTKEQISSGFLALKRIESCINNNIVDGSELVEACNDFYTKIPHDFGMKRPPLIKTIIQLKEELELIETLEGIEIALNMMNEEVIKLNPIDYHYKMLNCGLEPLEHSDKEFEMVELYVQNTHGETHRSYSLSVTDVFKCSKSGEDKNFRDYGNKMLLWHGSRLSNWPGILKQGLRIAPPEAPVTGYMFGKGVYFADMCSKSANYCHARDEGLLLLCEVSLGEQNKLKNSDYNANKLPKGKHSVMGLGRTMPNPEEDIMLPGDVKVTLGKPVQAKDRSYSLLYNEYIVYDVHQIKMRYLVRAKFNYGK
ncbi:poly [ADP-ribose] polymerase 2-like isoform X3 [Centruroides sculpturatus]|uniref:poly [ADP-ribose] polymerase 2-like isoform X1 n=1 Tax=Centruroides sculpturatus TaxID=218467 RepID=UPI000C6DDACF|nr:poly [ADP-ribose] polymerase 2-like isoform X1 [Centruroides sculpturatus]XP_023231703.1 poly [ADP-ribose] polymerase 2-like isoform X1 [Centruroides sculpturatus]XP_023231704.1 poly [ADP-ribose] polymerase 2-like isoform X1 [Centruroides sculpturatus]XP_023231705.1 poly [ADP-ribose] polymerase 2-like isoform X2 [Centruroides sculpturatus]XP_023231706.1 poly [ADP-ribose] polymerase 2-like isoform X3 [Centruroides sculpturatus]